MPAGTPANAVTKISADTGRVLKLPEIEGKLVSQGLYPAPSTPAQFDAHIRRRKDVFVDCGWS